MKIIYSTITPEGQTYTGMATYGKIVFTRVDYGKLNPISITHEELSQKINEIYNQYKVRFLKIVVSEEEPEKVVFGWIRTINFEFWGISTSPILVDLLPYILGIIITIGAIFGLKYVRHTIKDVFYSPIGEGLGNLFKNLGNYILPISVIGGIIFYSIKRRQQ